MNGLMKEWMTIAIAWTPGLLLQTDPFDRLRLRGNRFAVARSETAAVALAESLAYQPADRIYSAWPLRMAPNWLLATPTIPEFFARHVSGERVTRDGGSLVFQAINHKEDGTIIAFVFDPQEAQGFRRRRNNDPNVMASSAPGGYAFGPISNALTMPLDTMPNEGVAMPFCGDDWVMI